MESHGLRRAVSICPGPKLYLEVELTGCLAAEAQILAEDVKSLLDGLEQGPINTLAT